ncbi:MAG: phenylalanine--tRNA ligase subunit beta [Nitrososphaerota archaeon]|nr:phenylalanine--tRNA ligase subunit beta [Nitrososphaerota archaeon]
MPAITLSAKRMSKLIGTDLKVESLSEYVSRLGMSVEEVGDESLKVEYNPNRPDFSTAVGIARALKGIMGIEKGLPRCSARRSGYRVVVKRSVKSVRPWIGALVVDLREGLSEEDLVEVIAMQEDLHWILGRNRRKVAIGFHDVKDVTFPLSYTAVGLDSVEFVPLKADRRMTPREVLRVTEQGARYGHILGGSRRVPVIIDAKGNVISFPPIINSNLTEVTTGTKRIFVDVTGTDLNLVDKTISIIAAHFSDLEGRLSQVKIIDDGKVRYSPDLSPEVWRVEPNYLISLLGVEPNTSEVVDALKRMRLGVRRLRGGRLEVLVPPYRADVLHPVDFAEELAIGLGYDTLAPEMPASFRPSGLLLETLINRKIKEVMTGLGFTEVVNTTLSNRDDEFTKLLLDDDGSIKIVNPVSRDYDTLRRRLLPSLLGTLKNNKHHPYPQRFFEVGDAFTVDETIPERVRRSPSLCCVISHSSATYSEVYSVLDELCRFVNSDVRPVEEDFRFFIPGRGVALTLDGVKIGWMGEIHPNVLENFELSMPVATFELSLGHLIKRPVP